MYTNKYMLIEGKQDYFICLPKLVNTTDFHYNYHSYSINEGDYTSWVNMPNGKILKVLNLNNKKVGDIVQELKLEHPEYFI